MIVIACTIAAFAISAAMLLTLWRLAAGPEAVDRIFALDTLVINVIGILYGSAIYFEAALLPS